MNMPLHTTGESSKHLYCGMPPLRQPRRPIGRFEFWPSSVHYAPVMLQSLLLALRYRSLTIPLLANPGIFMSGMVGESKADILHQAGSFARRIIAPFVTHRVGQGQTDLQAAQLERALETQNISYPVVLKPDQGCRGMGVQLIRDRSAMVAYLRSFPNGHVVLAQRLSRWTAEAGLFYERFPGEAKGHLTSITLKYPPYVIGDGHRTLRQLIADDPRAGPLQHLYLHRHEGHLDDIVPDRTMVRLCFAGSHSRGALFRNGNVHITAQLEEALDRYMKDVAGFHIGRLDVRFASIDQLKRGEAFEIIEINGISGEPGHIWDPDARLFEIWGALLRQYRTLYRIGDQVRRQTGQRPPKLRYLLTVYSLDKALARQLPSTD